MLLIVTNRDDMAVDFLITKLEERNLPYFRLDSDVASKYSITARYGKHGIKRVLKTSQYYIDLDMVTCVWYRRAVRPDNPNKIEIEAGHYISTEFRHLIEGILPYISVNVKWVNPIVSTELAERKPKQLQIAHECGLLIPETIISNSQKDIMEFCSYRNRIICKPISQGLVSDESGWYSIHTEEINFEDLNEASELNACPTQFQSLIPKGSDVRLTIIGEKFFCIKISSVADEKIDWRAEKYSLVYEEHPVPEEIITGCKNLMKKFGLYYGAFDFVISTEGDWYFLEVNPAGEWAWLEVELDLPMRDAFIDLFYTNEACNN